jgi:hypothetical protein
LSEQKSFDLILGFQNLQIFAYKTGGGWIKIENGLQVLKMFGKERKN